MYCNPNMNPDAMESFFLRDIDFINCSALDTLAIKNPFDALRVKEVIKDFNIRNIKCLYDALVFLRNGAESKYRNKSAKQLAAAHEALVSFVKEFMVSDFVSSRIGNASTYEFSYWRSPVNHFPMQPVGAFPGASSFNGWPDLNFTAFQRPRYINPTFGFHTGPLPARAFTSLEAWKKEIKETEPVVLAPSVKCGDVALGLISRMQNPYVNRSLYAGLVNAIRYVNEQGYIRDNEPFINIKSTLDALKRNSLKCEISDFIYFIENVDLMFVFEGGAKFTDSNHQEFNSSKFVENTDFVKWIAAIADKIAFTASKDTTVAEMITIIDRAFSQTSVDLDTNVKSVYYGGIIGTLNFFLLNGVIQNSTPVIEVRNCVDAYYSQTTAELPEQEAFYRSVGMNLDQGINFFTFSNKSSSDFSSWLSACAAFTPIALTEDVTVEKLLNDFGKVSEYTPEAIRVALDALFYMVGRSVIARETKLSEISKLVKRTNPDLGFISAEFGMFYRNVLLSISNVFVLADKPEDIKVEPKSFKVYTSEEIFNCWKDKLSESDKFNFPSTIKVQEAIDEIHQFISDNKNKIKEGEIQIILNTLGFYINKGVIQNRTLLSEVTNRVNGFESGNQRNGVNEELYYLVATNLNLVFEYQPNS